MSDDALRTMRDLIQDDPGGRGLRTDPEDNLVTACPDDFAAACRSIAGTTSAKLFIVTGFHIAHSDPPLSETDGPLGALFLARALTPLGIEVVLAADGSAADALRAGVEACGLLERVPVLDLPLAWDENVYVDWMYSANDLPGSPLTHLIALERCGPSHTTASLKAQPGVTPPALEDFGREVPAPARDRCHSMRGRDVTAETSPAHLLFEHTGERDHPIVTIGIGDGGNELGMGKVPWATIRKNVTNGARIACRVPTDFLIVCGVSNWGAYALAAGVLRLRGMTASAVLFDAEKERMLLRRMVEAGPLVDGHSGKRTATVDGLEFDRYAEVLPRLAALLPAPAED
jgi:hypothetical protein